MHGLIIKIYLINKKKNITYDSNYSDKSICDWDASFQLLVRGFVKRSDDKIELPDLIVEPYDIYYFTRKYYKNIWVYKTLLQRIIFLHNPILELFAFIKSRKAKKVNLYNKHYVYEDYTYFKSELVKSKPYINIIIPTLNRYEALHNLLMDLEQQDYTEFKLIVIDQSNPFNKLIYKKYNLDLQVIHQKKAALWQARNNGVKLSNSEYLLFLDDDSRVGSNFIYEHIKCLDFFNADISSGISISKIGGEVPENYYYHRLSDQLDTGNVLIKKKVFYDCGLFDEKFEKMRMGDGEYGVRAYLNGFKNISNPYASRMHLKMSRGGLREMGHWDGLRPNKILDPRPIPSVSYFFRKYWGNEAALLYIINYIPTSLSPYRFKNSRIANALSLIIFLFIFPIIFFIILKSWYFSTRILKSKSMIYDIK